MKEYDDMNEIEIVDIDDDISQKKDDFTTLLFDYNSFREDRKKKLTAEKLAQKLEMSKSELDNIEHGRKRHCVTVDQYKAICEAAELDYRQYFKRVPIKKPTYKRPVVLTFLTNKGGAGKTSAAVNLAGALVDSFKKKCLVIDSDPQQNTTMHLGMLFPCDDTKLEQQRVNKVLKQSEKKNIYQAVMNKDDIQNHIQRTKWKNLDIVVSCDEMSLMDMKMLNIQLKELRVQAILKNLLEENPNGYDFIIFDCNPVLSQMNVSILYATDYVIVPLECAPFGLRGVQNVLDFVDGVREQHEKLSTLGILLNKYDSRKNITKEVYDVLYSSEELSKKIFDTKIPVSTMIETCQGYGEPLFVSYSKAPAGLAYKAFAEEVLNRIEVLNNV